MAVSMIPNTYVQITDTTAYMQLVVDTAADLEGLGSFAGADLVQGVPALDLETGDIYGINSEGTWNNLTGDAAATRAAVPAQNTKKLNDPDDDNEVETDAERDTSGESKAER